MSEYIAEIKAWAASEYGQEWLCKTEQFMLGDIEYLLSHIEKLEAVRDAAEALALGNGFCGEVVATDMDTLRLALAALGEKK